MERPAETTELRYPASGQVLRWARLAADNSAEDGTGRGLMPALADFADPNGNVRLGPLAILADYLAGVTALRSVSPDWPVTHDMAIHLADPCPVMDSNEGVGDGELEADCRVVRAGRNNVVSETSVLRPDGTEVARAQVTFTRLPRRDDTPTASPKTIVNLAEEAEFEAPRQPIDDACGFRLETGASQGSGSGPVVARPYVEFDHSPFVYNSLGAIQGGVIALALERAGTWAGEQVVGAPCVGTDLHLHYLALGRDGPFQARAEVLRVDGDPSGSRGADTVTSRVALHDTGNDDRLLALGVTTARRA